MRGALTYEIETLVHSLSDMDMHAAETVGVSP